MKKSLVLAIIAVVILGMVAGFRVFVTEEEPPHRSMTVGEKLAEMETESTKRTDNLIEEIKGEALSQAECRSELKGRLKSILDNLEQLRDTQGNYINVAYNCEIFRKLSGSLGDKKKYEKAELKLRKDNLSMFSDRVFSFCLDAAYKRQEEADYLKLSQWAEDIEANLDQEIERYTERVYAWYADK